MKTQILNWLAAVVLLTGAAHAQGLLTYNVAQAATATDWTGTFVLPQFDSSLGTLTQVQLTFSGEAWQMVKAENKSAGPSTFTLNSDTSLTLNWTGGAQFFNLPVSLAQSGALAAFDGTTDYAGTSGVTFNQDQTVMGIYLDPNLANYVGLGSVSFDAAGTTVASLTTSASSQKGHSSSASANLQIDYIFSPIPEPSTYASAAGLLVLGYTLIRRRTVSQLG